MGGRPVKHSLTLKGHRTSVSLEPEFWEAFREIAADRRQPINVLAAEIDRARGLETGLATAIRLFVLRHYRAGGGSPPEAPDPQDSDPEDSGPDDSGRA